MRTSESRIWAHMREVFGWSSGPEIAAAVMAAAAFGMAVPVMLGFLSGHPKAGFSAAIGALAVGRAEAGATLAARLRGEVEALGPAACAALLAVVSGGWGWPRDLVLVVAAAIAATTSGYSRSMAVAATRFVLFLMILSAVPVPDVRQGARFLVLVLLGASWTSALSLASAALARRQTELSSDPPPRQPTARQKFLRWKRSLSCFAGWSYPVRLTSCLAVGVVLERLWPNHHLHWIGLTVALLTPRQAEAIPIKITQRAIGTAVGVGAAEVALRPGMPGWGLVIAVALLAGARPLLRVRSYLAYSLVMTPLIVLIIDAGRAPEAGLLADRLLATVLGAALVIAAGRTVLRLLPQQTVKQ